MVAQWRQSLMRLPIQALSGSSLVLLDCLDLVASLFWWLAGLSAGCSVATVAHKTALPGASLILVVGS